MFETKVKIRKELLEKLKETAESQGCSSVEEFIESTLEKELDRIERSRKEDAEASRKQKEVDDITNKLKGLGYID